jgi:hypothetical protein
MDLIAVDEDTRPCRTPNFLDDRDDAEDIHEKPTRVDESPIASSVEKIYKYDTRTDDLLRASTLGESAIRTPS